MEKLKKKRILITGSSGFIGKNLVHYFKKKYIVFVPTHSRLDLLNPEQVRKFIIKNKIDVIIHCAIIGGGKEDEVKDVVSANLRMFFNLARNSHLVEKIIWFGSGLEYDKARPLKMVNEQDFDKKIPQDEYGLYKYICAKYTESSKNIYDLVLFGIYGKYEDYVYRFISNAIIKNLLRLPIVIMRNVYFDYLFIEDLPPVVDYFIHHKPKYHRYNVTSGKKIDLVAIARLINEASKFKSEIKVIKRGLSNEYSASNTRLRSEIKNLKIAHHKVAIAKLYNWYSQNMKNLDVKKVKNDPYLKFLKQKGTLYKLLV